MNDEPYLFKHCSVQFLGGAWHQGWIIPASAYPKANKKSKYYLLCDDGIVRGFSPTTVRAIKTNDKLQRYINLLRFIALNEQAKKR